MLWVKFYVIQKGYNIRDIPENAIGSVDTVKLPLRKAISTEFHVTVSYLKHTEGETKDYPNVYITHTNTHTNSDKLWCKSDKT